MSPTRASGILILTAVLLFTIALPLRAGLTITRIDPPNWWTGMRTDTLELMLYGSDLNGVRVRVSAPGVRLLGTQISANGSYAFITLLIGQACRPGEVPIVVSSGSDSTTVKYPLMARQSATGRYQGFTGADVIYLITPDRFADGDPANNEIPGMTDGYNPGKLIGRHGGDIRGIINHLDYLSDLGVTALWLNPVIENNTRMSYHGYAATDLYRIDPRFGTNDLYRELVEQAHRRGMKIILDHVNNHISINHPWIGNLPGPDWLNGSTAHHVNNRHQKIALTDPHADSIARANITDGWFQDYMPDLNQRSPLLARYLIQNTIWWIESTGLDGIREDTWSYSDPEFLSRWTAAILSEYPSFNIVGEVWLNDPVFIAPAQRGSCLSRINTGLPAVTDFGLFTPFMQVFGRDRADISVIHDCLAKDFLYPNPQNLVTFLDNHDVTRIMSICRGDMRRFRLACTMLLTLRGIPEILYGTELGMEGEGDHGLIRGNFPGGFPGDTRNAFTAGGRTAREDSVYTFLRILLRLRKQHPALQTGSMLHYPPRDNVYSYFRMDSLETVMVVVNNSDQSRSVTPSEFSSGSAGKTRCTDLVTGETWEIGDSVPVEQNSARILLLK